MATITIVEDDQLLRQELRYLLEKTGYEVRTMTQFDDQLIENIKISETDLLLLDLNLPHQSGFEICKQLTATTNLPILVLTTRDQLKDELKALELGADDYVTKPFNTEKLLARIQSVLRRSSGQTHINRLGSLQLDTQTFTVYVHNQVKVLNQNEGKILLYLMQLSPQTVTKEALTYFVWGTNQYIDENTLQVNIGRLRKNLNELGLFNSIETVRGQGYRLRHLQKEG
ncbi:response regulator [Fundicoccus culcitae]|uniref:Response regulator transcription factor n=1 Tax=Fundicoccus culcitae TaxID=2969821 RepID=A0ABY5P4D7_9LACT|nr:response regulator transcription factor [Fundicoccus culcitae]UUX33240.1 response regulator transcription factor [Fundicoccus culcitae]